MTANEPPMPSIQANHAPLVFKIGHGLSLPQPDEPGADRIAIRTVTRALAGMQKEAIVNDAFCGTAWRMLSDEGPWLNGTDLSSFPLGFFSAGMIATLATEMQALARWRRIQLSAIRLVQRARYSMEGSALKRTMVGTALPLEIAATVAGDASAAEIEALVCHALAASPADAVMRSSLPGRFGFTLNGQPVAAEAGSDRTMHRLQDPARLFDQIMPDTRSAFEQNIIRKIADTEPADDAGSGRPVGLATEQKRLLEVQAILTLREDGLKVIQVKCVQPSGSVFEFLCDDPAVFGGRERAPTGLQYLSAGVAFCYMTQLGRFAQIVKHDLAAYGVVQDTLFSLPGGSAQLDSAATAFPVDTHAFIRSDDDIEANRVLMRMAEQTCYLHACYRGVNKTRLRVMQ